MTNFNTQSGVVYIKKANSADPYTWAGRFAQLAEIVTPYGDQTPTQAFNPRGGIYVDGTLTAEAGVVTTTMTIKAEHYSRARTELVGKKFNIDRRMHIEGVDRDSPNSWIDIERMMEAKATTRTTPKTASTAQEEAMVEIPFSGRTTVDIYRVNYSDYALAALAVPIVGCYVSEPVSSRSDIASMYAVTGVNATHVNVNLLFNPNNAGNADWVIKELVGVITEPNDIIGFGNFVGILFDEEIVRSDTFGDTVSVVTPPSWVGQTLTSVFGLDQTLIYACGVGGFVSRSKDGMRTWKDVLAPGSATSEDLTGGGSLDNRVSYTYGANGTIVLTIDGGESWYKPALAGLSLTPGILSMTMIDKDNFVFITDEGSIYSTDDGGDTVSIQGRLEGLPVGTYLKAVVDVSKGDVGHLVISNATNSYFYRNADGVADGFWYTVNEGNVLTDAIYNDMTVLGTNTVSLVGSNVLADDNLIGTAK